MEAMSGPEKVLRNSAAASYSLVSLSECDEAAGRTPAAGDQNGAPYSDRWAGGRQQHGPDPGPNPTSTLKADGSEATVAASAQIQYTAERLRKKVRLKRRDRDLRSNGLDGDPHHRPNQVDHEDDDSEGGRLPYLPSSSSQSFDTLGSDADSGDNLVGPCCLQLPGSRHRARRRQAPTTTCNGKAGGHKQQGHYQGLHRRRTSSLVAGGSMAKRHQLRSTSVGRQKRSSPQYYYHHRPVRHSVLIATVFVLFSVAIIGMALFSVSLQKQLASLTMHFETVMEERKSMAESNHLFHTQIAFLISNQTALQRNMSAILNIHSEASKTVHALNRTVEGLMESLNSAPYMKSLPSEVKDAQKNIAKFGSQLTELESRMLKAEGDISALVRTSAASGAAGGPAQLANRTATLEANLTKLSSKFKEFGVRMAGQLQRQEENSSKGWEAISKIQEDLKTLDGLRDQAQNATGRISALETKVLVIASEA